MFVVYLQRQTLKYCIMETRILISLTSFEDGVRVREWYKNTVILPRSVSFDFEQTKKVLSVLYPKATMIHFLVDIP